LDEKLNRFSANLLDTESMGCTIFATAILDLVSQFQMRLTSAGVVASRLFAGGIPEKITRCCSCMKYLKAQISAVYEFGNLDARHFGVSKRGRRTFDP
jgi:hypothetical protein